ncbi:MAG: DUF2007 domain-containing protein, partial [Polyangiaceae bacterium]
MSPADDDEEKKEEAWVELRRFNDPLEADMAKDFLEQSGVPVLVRGNSGVTGVLNRFDTILDIRLTVPEAKLAVAREALEAMQTPARNEEPFRGFGHEKEATHDQADENGDAPIPRKKSPFVAMGFALMLPIGGGHMYAEHRAAGKIFGFFIIVFSAFAIFTHLAILWLGVFALIAVDALFAPFAVSRYNRGAVTPDRVQRTWAEIVVMVLILAVGAY